MPESQKSEHPMEVRPKLDLTAVELPLALRTFPFEADLALAERWRGALAGVCPASDRLVAAGFLPPQALTGNTIFLAFRNYDLEGGVYAREQVTYRRPVELGETLEIEGEIAATYLRKGRRYRIMRSVSKDAAGRVVVESRSTGVAQLATVVDQTGKVVMANETPPAVSAPDAFLEAAADNPCRERLLALEVGAVLASGRRSVTLEMMRAQAGEDDRNPIHTDQAAAERAGLDAPIAGGPHVLAFLQETMMERLGDQLLLHGSHFDVRWIRPVRAGSTIEAEAEIAHAGADKSCVEFDLRIACEGEPAMVGRARIPV